MDGRRVLSSTVGVGKVCQHLPQRGGPRCGTCRAAASCKGAQPMPNVALMGHASRCMQRLLLTWLRQGPALAGRPHPTPHALAHPLTTCCPHALPDASWGSAYVRRGLRSNSQYGTCMRISSMYRTIMHLLSLVHREIDPKLLADHTRSAEKAVHFLG